MGVGTAPLAVLEKSWENMVAEDEASGEGLVRLCQI